MLLTISWVGWTNMSVRGNETVDQHMCGMYVKVLNRYFLLIGYLLLLIIPVLSLAVIDEETARMYFTQALEKTYAGDFKSAYELALKSMSGRVYVEELPHFWYLRGRLAIINGLVDKALEDFKNFTVLVRNDNINNLMEKVGYFRRLNLAPSQSFTLGYINSIKGNVRGIEYFQTPTSLSVYGDNLVLLDQKNKRLVFFKNNKMMKIKKFSKNVKQVFYNKDGNLYVLGEKSLYDENEQEVLGGLQVPYIAGSDRSGTIYIVDFDRVIKFNPNKKERVEFKLPQRTFCLDAELTVSRLYILDALRQKIEIFRIDTMEKVDEVKLPEKVWSFEVTPYGDIIYLGKDKVVANGKEYSIKDVDFIEYSYPTLFAIKWKGNTVEQYFFKDDKPVFVNIELVSFDENNAYAYISVENLFGDELHYIKYALAMYEHDVYVPTDIYAEQRDIRSVKVEKCTGELISYRLQGVKVIGNCPILTRFTGSVASAEELLNKKILWVAKWTYLKPVPPGVIKLSAKVSFKEQSYYDTMFYTQKLILNSIAKSNNK
jgi:hypothetical protein